LFVADVNFKGNPAPGAELPFFPGQLAEKRKVQLQHVQKIFKSTGLELA